METAQEIFDTVYHHFITNKQPRSTNTFGGCQYRGPNGTKCAVGVLLTDDECAGWDDLKFLTSDNGIYMTTLGLDWMSSVISSGDFKPNVTYFATMGVLPDRLKPHLALISALQCVHDYNTLLTHDSFKQVSNHFSLAIPAQP